MRNCLIEIDRVNYIPVRAIPFVTGGVFTPSLVRDVLCGKDRYLSMHSYCYQDSSLEKIEPDEWRSVVKVEKFDDLPAGTVVRFDAIIDSWVTIFPPPDCAGDEVSQGYAWPSTGELLPDDVYDHVMRGLVTHPAKTKHRKNAASKVDDKILAAIEKIENLCLKAGVPFSRKSPPGTKEQLLKCIGIIDPSVSMALSTFKDHAKALGLKWKQGTKSSMGEEMLNIVRNELG